MKLKQKLKEIYNDLENNITRIYERQDLHMLYDLAWHSTLQFDFMGQRITRGWVEVLAIGDTRCGKTKTAERLLRHYRAGEMGTGENTSLAGLLGGMQQISKQWSIVWGKIPRNDRRLVVIDEASNLPVHIMPEFATIRSEGVARITKIQSEQTRARTRLIWVSNPRVDKMGRGLPISGYDYGVLTIPELLGRQADIARLDAAIIVASGEVSEDILFQPDASNKVVHKYTTEACHNLIMWAWSRKPDQIIFEKETEQEIIHVSKNLSRIYHDSIPLVKLEEQPEKIARMSAALAARVFSHRNYNDLVVLPYHVSEIVDFLTRIYSSPTMGYLDYSKKQFDREILPEPDKIVKEISQYGLDFVEGMLSFEIIRQNVIEDLTGLDRDSVRRLLSLLVRKKCLRPEHTWYRKSTPFIKLLKDLETKKELFNSVEEF